MFFFFFRSQAGPPRLGLDVGYSEGLRVRLRIENKRLHVEMEMGNVHRQSLYPA